MPPEDDAVAAQKQLLLPVITRRPLTDAEALLLHQELKTTPNILGYTVRELLRLTDVFVAEVNGQFAGVCFSIDLAANWTEIAALYVLPAFRGGGMGKALFYTAWERVQKRARHVYVLSRNPQVVIWMRELGMTVNGHFWSAPFSVQWYTIWYMASWHRRKESVRKFGQIMKGPSMMQGMKKQE